MTGLECLQQELIERGCTKSQAEAKGVMIVLDILSKSPERIFSLVEEARNKLRALQEEATKYTGLIDKLKREAIALQADNERARANITAYCNTEFEREQAYIDRFFEALNSCETPEGRDRLKAAQVYANSAILETKYDNTVYNNWMGALLCGASATDGLEEIRSVNPKIDTTNAGWRKVGRRL